ncbi:hypothetical protein BpHYR1_013233 [Brachionus plicatilis]|uniref:Uncharacterized protein n=1 Tax=Brachionus plicatilis TaxID=10195 RepID=A0A3M7RS70_BRAPC|nr:hypothetical protein BpHYR1_013233 [Brachionus plicatilis]
MRMMRFLLNVNDENEIFDTRLLDFTKIFNDIDLSIKVLICYMDFIKFNYNINTNNFEIKNLKINCMLKISLFKLTKMIDYF